MSGGAIFYHQGGELLDNRHDAVDGIFKVIGVFLHQFGFLMVNFNEVDVAHHHAE